MWLSLKAFVRKEFRQMVRDPRTLAVLLIAPAIQLLIFGYAVSLEVTDVSTVLVDEARTDESRRLLEELTAGEMFDALGYAPNAAEAQRMVERGEATVAVVVPADFSRELADDDPATVQFLIDGSNSNWALGAQNAAEAFMTRRGFERLEARLERRARRFPGTAAGATLTIVPTVYYNPGLKSRYFFLPGVAASILLIVVVLVTALATARERETGTLEQVLVTPMSPLVLLLGKTVPFGLVGLVDLAAVLAAAAILFGMPIRGSLLLVFGAGTLFLVAILGIALLISIRARTQQQAFVAAMFFNLPAILLSGFLTPVGNMPGWLQPITIVNPIRHFIDLLRSVLIRQATVGDLVPQLVAMAGIGVATYMFAGVYLRGSLD